MTKVRVQGVGFRCIAFIGLRYCLCCLFFFVFVSLLSGLGFSGCCGSGFVGVLGKPCTLLPFTRGAFFYPCFTVIRPMVSP